MAQNEKFRNHNQPDDAPDPDLAVHLQSLGLQSVEEYRDWCKRHGFGLRTSKHWRERLKERAFATREVASRRLRQKKSELRKPEQIIDWILNGELTESDVTQFEFKVVCQAVDFVNDNSDAADAIRRLLRHVCQHSNLLSAQPALIEHGRRVGATFVAGLFSLARHSSDWTRPVEDWKPRTHNLHRQFASLARHLFARWPVPGFMDSVWFQGQAARDQQQWFLHIGRGESIRTARLPLHYTKRMAHHFLQAPADLSADAALRWGQIRALGGNERLVRAVIATRLGREFDHDDFWCTVFRWLIAHPTCDGAQVGPIVDYLHNQRFCAGDVTDARCEPAQPNLTMKGRTPCSLQRQVAAWHGRLADMETGSIDWASSGFEPFHYTEGSAEQGTWKVWTLTEIRDKKALVAEGREMQHCVATYAGDCALGLSSIWSLEMQNSEGHRKILTVEVHNPTRMICQARGKWNALPSEKEWSILWRWADQAGLDVAKMPLA